MNKLAEKSVVVGSPLQGCQMKISMKSQTMLKRGQKKAKHTVLRPEKSQALFAVLPFLCHNKHLS